MQLLDIYIYIYIYIYISVISVGMSDMPHHKSIHKIIGWI